MRDGYMASQIGPRVQWLACDSILSVLETTL